MSTATAVTMLDVRAGSGAITLPLTTQIPYRVITIKDAYGAAGLSSITINTQGTDVFENGASSITLTNAYDTTTLYAGLPGYWYTIGGSRLQGAAIGSLSTGVIVNPLRLGTLSTQTAIQFPGLRSNYTGAVIAEQTTGVGTQELLLYKASSISDQIRLQTTGNIVFEAGASARSFPSTTALATPTLYIAGSTSNVGVGTATPAATLDVAGTGRFQTVSSFALNVSSINGQTFGQPIQSTVIGLGTAGYISTAAFQSTVAGINYAISQNTVDTVFYLNPGTAATTYRQMSPSQTTFPQSTMTTFITRNTSNIPIAQFQTDFTVPQVIPDGAWDLNLFAYTDHATTYIYTSLFSRAGVAETLIASSSNATTNIGTSPVQQYTNTLFVPQTIFTSTTGVSLVLKVFANNPNNQDDNLYTYYQGGNYSHAHTTFGTVVPDTLFTSTVAGLGTAGYVSTLVNLRMISSLEGYVSSFRTDSLTVGGPTGFVTVQDLITGTVSTGQLVAGAGFISSLQINSLSFGPSGYVIVGDVIANSLSTKKLNTQALYTNNAYIGNVSSQSAILFPGIDGTYRGTALAEQTTGIGRQELLLYKVSSTTDQIRLQTTGNIVFEAGAASRSWPSTAALTTPTLYIAGSSSNVGIGTAAPATTLDVVGTGRFQTLSSLALNTSSINSAQGYISSLVVDSLAIGSNSGFINMGDVITTSLSSLQINTGLFIASGAVSTPQLIVSTINGAPPPSAFNGSTTTISSAVINVSSLSSASMRATQGYISSLTVDSLTIGFNTGFVDMGDVITTSLSTIQLNTGLFTASGAVCTPQVIVSSINGAAPWQISFLTSTTQGLTSNISSMIDPTELTSTITGLGTAGFISTVGLTYAVASTAQGLGTFGYTSTNQLLSTTIGVYAAINSNANIGFSGSTNNLFIPYGSNNTVSTFTLVTNTPSSIISFGTNTGKTQSQVYIGDLFNQLNLSTNISPVVLIDSVFPTNSITVSTFRSSGIFIVPSNVSFINVHLWGSGGSNSGSVGGGGGAFLTGFLPVTPGQRLHVTVNQGGGRGQGGYVNVNGGGFAGIYEYLSTATNVLAVAAGGGGGGGYSDRGGGGGGVFVGKTVAYSGGTQTTPGNYGTAYKLQGGDGPDNSFGAGPGGGGGWFGGSGGSGDSVGIVSGAGGSSYFSNLINWVGEDGANGHLGGLGGGKWSPYYASNYGDSNTIGAAVIAWAPTLRQTNLLELRDVTQGRLFGINRNLNMGIGVSSIGNNYTFELNGTAFISTLYTPNTNTSNITIPLSNINPLTFTSTQAIFAMNTISSGSQVAFGTTQAYGLYGKYSQVYMGDIKQLQGNFTNSDPVLRIEQDFPLTPSSNVSIISFSTTVTTYTVPAGMTMAKAYLWGQGGKGWGGTTSNGGGGAFVSGTFNVIPGEQLAVAVNYGAGGGFGANGGGLVGIFRSTIAQSNSIAIAAGGGGGGSFVTTVGGYGGVIAGSSGSYRGPNVGVGATQTSAGAGAGEGASSGGALQGGGGGAGGGAGYFGGGGGGNNSVDQVGGGGGSSFIGGLFPGSVVAENGNLGTPPGIGPLPGLGLGGGKFSPFYFGTNGDGGASGWGVIVFSRAFRQTNLLELRGPTSRNLVAVDSQMNMAINVSSVTSSITLDVGGIGRFITLSSFALNVSSINGVVPGGTFNGSTLGISTSIVRTSTLNTVFLSSVQGYVSSFRTDSLTVGGPTGFVTIQDLITGTASTGQLVAGAGFISSLQINSLSFGPSGYVIVGDVIANSLSTKILNTQAFYTNNAYIGNVSSQSAILFPGIDRNFRGTAVAEQTTGIGAGELLLYKVSTTADQIRLQTTGNIVFEAGAASRSWPSTSALATPTLYIQGSSSNVGIGTAAPAATLDVVGTGRFQTLSSLALNVSSINGAAPGGATFNGSTTTLSSAVINVSSLSSAYVYAAQGYISSLIVDYLGIGSNVGFINMGDIITTSHSTLQINTGVLTASGQIQAQTLSTLTLNVSSINGAAPGGGATFTGSTLSLSTASVFTSSLRASTISVGGGAWMSNDGLYLSNVQAGGAVGKLITNAGYVKLVTATAWNGGYGAFAITGGDLTPKIYMNAGQAATGAQMAIGGFNPSPGAGISLDVFGTGRFSTISTIQAITSSMGVGTNQPQALLDVAGTGRFQGLSTLNLQVSSINGALPGSGSSGGGTTFVGSTTFLSASQILFSTQTGYNISSVVGYVSSLQVDELQIGTGYGIIGFGDTNMSSISTLGIAAGLGNFQTINVSSINGLLPGTGTGSATSNFGTVSSMTALRFYGLTGGFTNTAVAEVSTGAGTQELLLYKVSSVSDQVRVQTTGNVIFETGVSARGWPTALRATVPTFYVAGSNSNVGIGTSNPLTTLDVVGTGRFQTLSSLNITAGSINYSIAFV